VVVRVNQKMAFSKRSSSGAFTLIELVVVMSIIVALAAMMLPALTKARQKAQGISCMNNSRQLALAWLMYADDNAGVLVENRHGNEARNAKNPNNWISGWMDWSSSSDNTNMVFLNDPAYAKLALYSKRTAKLYKCPADQSKSQNNPGPRVRSISMNAALGDGNKVNFGNWSPTFYFAKKLAELTRPVPSMAWVLVDEHPDSINDGCFFVNPHAVGSLASWKDLPASYHNGAAGFAFADGHSEIKRWQDAPTKRPVNWGDFPGLACPNSSDYTWVADRTPRQ
jgi:prepilin-type processing-associated H-X9-DG protein